MRKQGLLSFYNRITANLHLRYKNVDSTLKMIYYIIIILPNDTKVTRDKVLSNWKFKENKSLNSSDYGCGYPSGTQFSLYLLLTTVHVVT